MHIFMNIYKYIYFKYYLYAYIYLIYVYIYLNIYISILRNNNHLRKYFPQSAYVVPVFCLGKKRGNVYLLRGNNVCMCIYIYKLMQDNNKLIETRFADTNRVGNFY